MEFSHPEEHGDSPGRTNFFSEKQEKKTTGRSEGKGKKSREFSFFFALMKFSLRAVALCVVVVAAAAVSFLIFYQPPPEITVPRLIGKSFVDATLLLQERQVYPSVMLRYTNDPLDKGKVIEQDPNAGESIRKGREVKLVISRGAVVSSIADYVGKYFHAVQEEMRNQFAGFNVLLKTERVKKVFDNNVDPQVVIAQHPPPGSKISGKGTGMSFVVSRGNKTSSQFMPDFVGLSFEEVFQFIEITEANFEFYLSDRNATLVTETEEEVRRAGVVLDQSPAPGVAIGEREENFFRFGIRIADSFSSNDAEEREEEKEQEKNEAKISIFSFNVPHFDEPRSVRIYKQKEDETKVIFRFLARQKKITVPHRMEPGLRYEAKVGDTTVFRYTVPERE